ncbi:MAG: shikimate dehydrogenase [Spirochaetes bacterium]|nr:shikimate dehydrogenase [Spirochaetota bacterium]
MMINTGTGVIGLFGHPVEHSLSPYFMNFALKGLNLNFLYLSFDIEKENLKDAVNSLKVLKFRGVNVTIPYKRPVMSLLSSIQDDAKAIGAVNCILNSDGFIRGYNTDCAGFIEPLKKRNIEIRDTSACIIGCGGAARSVLYALVKENVKRIYIVNRTEKNASDFIAWSKESLKFDKISYIGNGQETSRPVLDDTALIVNTTPVGMFPNTEESPLHENLSFNHTHTIYDLIYNPPKTRLLKMAEADGAAVINGFEMLIIQGLYSLAIWFPDKKEEIFSMRERIIAHTAGYLKNSNKN